MRLRGIVRLSSPKGTPPPHMIQFHYRLGLLCEEKKDFHAAGEAYQRFLHYWKDADADLPILADARSRLGAVEAQAIS